MAGVIERRKPNIAWRKKVGQAGLEKLKLTLIFPEQLPVGVATGIAIERGRLKRLAKGILVYTVARAQNIN